ncbi:MULTISPECIES: hypothetical protein [unclassified Bradyrhizobium]|uniref:hypothetical protein n=1 Tax=unclassified Bradyrhizobium TaxID=2631580 RepID=UPI00339098CA
MATRKEVPQRGSFFIADGGRAEIHDKRDRIRKGQFMTVDAVVDRPASLEQQFPMMADQIKAAGPLGGPAFERESATILELARRLQAVREQLQATRKRK